MRLSRRPYFFEIVMLTVVYGTVAFISLVGVHLDEVDVGDVVWAVVLSGAAACALVELGKRLLPFRAVYNRRETGYWMRERLREVFPRVRAIGPRNRIDPDAEAAMALEFDAFLDPDAEAAKAVALEFVNWIEFAGWAIEGLDDALQAPAMLHNVPYMTWWDRVSGRWMRLRYATLSAYNLPAEQFVAQVAIAADRSLRGGLVTIVDVPSSEEEAEEAAEAVRRQAWVYSLLRLRPSGATSPDQDRYRTPEERLSWYADEVAFALDQLQNQLTTRWRFRVQLASVALSGAVAAVSVLATDATHAGAYVLAALLFGGFVSWVVRDATASLERFRR